MTYIQRLAVLAKYFPEYAAQFSGWSEAEMLDHAIALVERGNLNEQEGWFVDYFHPENVKTMPVFFAGVKWAIEVVQEKKQEAMSVAEWAMLS